MAAVDPLPELVELMASNATTIAISASTTPHRHGGDHLAAGVGVAIVLGGLLREQSLEVRVGDENAAVGVGRVFVVVRSVKSVSVGISVLLL